MTKIKTLLIITIVLVLCSPVLSSAESARLKGKSCTTPEGRLEYIKQFTSKHYDWLLKKVERVPPDIERYISSELRDSFNTSNETKFNLVVSNKFYYPWKLRDSIQQLITESKEGYSKLGMFNLPENEIIFYTNLLEKNFKISTEFSEYVSFDNRRKPRVLNDPDQNIFFTFSLNETLYTSIIQDLIRCSFKK